MNITKYKKCIESINEKITTIDDNCVSINYTYWCPKNFTDPMGKGFTFYAYGGRVLDLYADENENEICSLFDVGYFSFFTEGKDIVEKEYGKLITVDDKLLVIKDWSSSVWKYILSAFRNRAENIQVTKNDKLYLERERENAIAHVAQSIDKTKIMIVDMESAILIPEKNTKAKADLIAVRLFHNIPYISYIEYKCTDGGMDGTDLKKHFEDMQVYYDENAIMENVKELFERRMLLTGKSISGIRWEYCKKEIVFLFSHVDAGKDRNLTRNKILSHIKKLMDFDLFRKLTVDDKAKVCFWIIKDEFTPLEEKKSFTYKELESEMDDLIKNKFIV